MIDEGRDSCLLRGRFDAARFSRLQNVKGKGLLLPI